MITRINPGKRMSEAVVYNGTIWLAGQVGEGSTVTEQTPIPDPGFYRLPNVSRPWRDHLKWGHGYVDIYTGIIKSCDTYFYDLAYKLGIDKIADFMTKAGFVRPSGIDLHEENEGNEKGRLIKRPKYFQDWEPCDLSLHPLLVVILLPCDQQEPVSIEQQEAGDALALPHVRLPDGRQGIIKLERFH